VFGPAGDLYVIWSQKADASDAVFAAHRAADSHWTEGGRDPIRLSSPAALA
jgi:hypothetical protein